MPDTFWERIGGKILREYGILRLREDRYRLKTTGAEADFAVCESLDWVLIIPITEDGQVCLVRQFRHALGATVLEIPGGVMEPGETPRETAARELREETGYVAENIEIHGPLLPNPALNTARCFVAVARGCRRLGAAEPDPLELIELDLRPLNSVRGMIREGELQHALCVAAFAITGVHEELP